MAMDDEEFEDERKAPNLSPEEILKLLDDVKELRRALDEANKPKRATEMKPGEAVIDCNKIKLSQVIREYNTAQKKGNKINLVIRDGIVEELKA